jgi:NADH dehydrogenase
MLAPVAIQGGRHAARVIAARLQGRADPVFRYKDKGTMATIGRGSAVAQLGPIRLSGFIAWLMWLFVHLIYLIGFRSRAIAIASWAWNFFFYDRPVRLIIEPPGDRLAEP